MNTVKHIATFLSNRFQRGSKTLDELAPSRRIDFRVVTILLALYLAFVAASALFIRSASGFGGYAVVFGIDFLLLLGTLPFLCRFFSSLSIKIRSQSARTSWFVFALALLFAGLTLGVNYWHTFPGMNHYDPQWQTEQIHAGAINDWHPAAHTLLMALCFQAVDEQWFALAVQNAALALGIAAMAAMLYAWGFSAVWIVIFVVATTVNESTLDFMRLLYKDDAFAIFGLFFTICCIQIFLSSGKWLVSILHLAAFAVAAAGTILMRHNGFFYVYPALIVLPFFFPKYRKSAIISILLPIALVACVKGPIYRAFHVTRYDFQRNIEVIGVPMTLLGGVLTDAPEKLPADIRAFLNTVASEDFWNGNFEDDWGSIKCRLRPGYQDLLLHSEFQELDDVTFSQYSVFITGEADDPVLARSLPQYALMAARAVWAAPTEALRPALKLTAVAWNPLYWETGTPGLFLILILASAVFRFPKIGYKSLIFLLPVLAYNFGTMLLLTTYDNRYFFIDTLVALPILYALWAESEDISCSQPNV